MSQYPIILIPGGIERAKSALPPVPAFTEPLPQQPGVEPQKLNTTVIVVEATVATVPRYSEGYHYTPDFAYIDPDLNLYIDIEIDEPYKSNGEPIHFIELDTQGKRDDHFYSRGWIVIRFSEEQVARWPKSCCKTIATVITDISENESMLNKFTDVPNLQTVTRWTQAEARQMALSKFRDKY